MDDKKIIITRSEVEAVRVPSKNQPPLPAVKSVWWKVLRWSLIGLAVLLLITAAFLALAYVFGIIVIYALAAVMAEAMKSCCATTTACMAVAYALLLWILGVIFR